MSFQDRTQHQIGQIDKEVRSRFPTNSVPACSPNSGFVSAQLVCIVVLILFTSQLSKYPALNNFEKQTSVPKVYAFLGLVGIYFFLIFFNIAGEFLVNIAGFIIPGYYSLDALFSASKTDDTQVSPLIPYLVMI